MAIAEEMGVALQSTATSVNIKERLDFSCALFDASGALIANAPHIPVHLGSMGESIRTIIDTRGGARDGRGIRRGDAYALNDPYRGGTHLPDITVIVPVFYNDRDETPSAYVAARGHHADVGGIAPGSMPPDSRSIDQEGVLIDNALLVDEGRFCEAEIRALLTAGPYPTRNADRNLSDLRAQLAACIRGAERLTETARDVGADVVAAYMGHVLANAEEAVRRLIDGWTTARSNIRWTMARRSELRSRSIRRAIGDVRFHRNQRDNCPTISTRRGRSSARPRSMSCAPDRRRDPDERRLPAADPAGRSRRSMLSPAYPAAVVAGNVETSQVVTDALFAATGRLAPSQGTMNNLTFGNGEYQYYETIAGGSGAGPDHDGTDAVQTHMTNSRLTDPEILETRFPVRLEEFAIRKGSGGDGAHRGGNGVVRNIRFLEPMRVNILANRRRIAPKGIKGGGDAAPGRNWIERADGRMEVWARRDRPTWRRATPS